MWVALATAGVVVVAFVFLGCAGFDLVVAALAAVVAMGVVVVTVVVLVVAVVDVVVMVDEVVLVVTLVVVAVVVAVEVEVEVEVGDGSSSKGERRTRKRKMSNLRRLSMSVAEAPRTLSRKVSSLLSDQDPYESTASRRRCVSSFAGTASASVAEAPRGLSQKVGFFFGGHDSAQEPAEGRPRSFSGFAKRLGGRSRTQSCPVAAEKGSDETAHLNLNAMD
mmetsp:Transcript_2559/g.6990  ORF Transcript_2559/g.6990 Transcript_2559/m.6990 type:complete len:221 (+) Transcript_2559:1595-2257(+)